MGKVKKKWSTYNKTLFTFFFGLVITSLFFNCNHVGAPELDRLDTLYNSLSRIEQNLSLDLKTIDNRKDEIFMQINWINRFDTTKMTLAFSHQIAQYEGLGKSYKRYLNKYEKMYNQRVSLLTVVDSIKDQAKMGIERSLFKKKYGRIRQKIDALEKETEVSLHHINEIEPIYQRLSKRMSVYIERLGNRKSKVMLPQ